MSMWCNRKIWTRKLKDSLKPFVAFRAIVLIIVLLIVFVFHRRHSDQISFRQYNYVFDDEIILYENVSSYSNLTVAQSGSLRMLRFDRFGTEGVIHVDDHQLILFDYMRLQLLTLLWNNEPKRILIVGLGAGILPRILHQLSPSSFIDVVEIDPIVFHLAKTFFYFPSIRSIEIFIEDGRLFLERQRSNRYDLILIDVFKTNGRIPHQLRTIECLGEYQRILKSNGLLAMNLLDDRTSRYRQTFARAQFKHIYQGDAQENVVLIALQKHATIFNRTDLIRQAKILQKKFILSQFDWQEEIRYLTNVDEHRWNRSANFFIDEI